MRTILVPVDTSSTSKNTVRYAASWASHYDYNHIILLKSSDGAMFDYLNISDGYSLVNEDIINKVQEGTELMLERLCRIIKEIAPSIIISKAVSQLTILRSINELIRDQHSVELIILGSDVKENSDSFVSDNIISIARVSSVKTLIVPDGYSFKKISKVLVPYDLSQIKKLDRISKFKTILHDKNLQLLILNVDTKEILSTDARKKDSEEYIAQNLNNIPYSIHRLHNRNIINGILSFAITNEADLIIALPGEHSFLYYLANRSISEGLYQNISKPVMILK